MSSSAVLTSVRRLRSLLAAGQGGEQSDEQLLAAFADRRDEIAFATLVRRHGPMVLGVCRRVLGHVQDAEDAYQATFLVLARRAAALRNKTALSSFLHGAAYHLASKIKRAAGRRHKYEGQAPARSPIDPADELLWREVRELLDDEIARLPEKYRSVFVLCCLENLSRAEAGQRLGLKERTVLSRLAKARKRLSQRLARRGVELTTVLATTALATSLASAVPAGLMVSTIQAAMATAAGEELAGIVSASVAQLVKSATTAMMVSKAKIATVILLTASMLAGASVWAYRGLAANALTPLVQPAGPHAAKVDDKPKAASPQRDTAETVEIKGRVLGPDGRPKAGANLLLLGEDKKIAQVGATAANGRFTVLVPNEAKDRYLIARTNDAGIDFQYSGNWQAGKPLELRLVKDRPIRGRVINTEGKPVVGMRVVVCNVRVYSGNSLDAFLIAWDKRRFADGRRSGELPETVKGRWPEAAAPFEEHIATAFRWSCEKGLWSEAAVLFAATTDTDGRFVVRGVGAERVFLLRLSGAGMAENEFWVINRDGFDPKHFIQEMGLNPHAPRGLSGPEVSVVAETERIIRGVVADTDNGKGRPGVVVRLTREINDRTGSHPVFPPLLATTDAQGRYEIHGARKAKSYLLEVASDARTGYLGKEVWIEDTPGYQPALADIGVRKGTMVRIQDAEGKQLFGVEALGTANRMDGDCCTICCEATDQPNLLVFHHPKQKLIGMLTLRSGEKLPSVVKLRPMGSLKGRLLDADGKPLARVAVDPIYRGRGRQAEDIDRVLHEMAQSVTDTTGAFTLDELMPGLQFALSFRRGKRLFMQTAQVIDTTFQVAPGECRDLGAIEVKQVRERMAR